MGVRKVRNSIILVLILLLASGIIQCATKTRIIKENDEAVLRRRVQEYWSYRIKSEWDKSYLYESPDYREKINIVRYINQNGRSAVKWEGFEILEIWASGEEGHVKLNTKYRYLIPQMTKGVFDRTIDEEWIKKEGEWCRRSPGI
jgi:hypothetical protein